MSSTIPPEVIGPARTRRSAPARLLACVTRLGWSILAASLLAAVLSRWQGWQEFGVITAAGLAALVMAILFALGRSRYRVLIDLHHERVVVGQPAQGRVRITNTAVHRLLPVRIELPIGPHVRTLMVPSLRGGAVHVALFDIPTERRGIITVGPARSVRGDALGVIRRVLLWTDPEPLYVHPPTVPLDRTAPGFIRDLEGQPSKAISNDDVSFHALRGYVPGDDRRYIHWRSSARTGALMVRQFEETRRSHLAVALSTRQSDYTDAAEFEIAVAACASLGLQSFREERALSVVTDERPLPTGTARRLLDQMSGVHSGEEAPNLVTVAQHASRSVPEVSVAVLLCGSTPTLTDIRTAANCFPPAVRVIAVRVVTGSPIGLRSIGAAAVVTVGDLPDLGRALRAVR